MTEFKPKFSPDSLRRITDETFLVELEYHREISSTNDRALALSAAPDRDSPLLVLAETQIAGRGRHGNRWWSDDGGLTFSLLLEGRHVALPKQRWPQLALVAGLAACETISALAPAAPVGLKWPNDVFLGERKVGGILVEVPSQAADRIVIGIGINVNGTPPAVAQTGAYTATSLAEQTGTPFAFDEVLIALLHSLERLFATLPSDDEASRDDCFHETWGAYCLLTGRDVSIAVGDQVISGVCLGIDRDGALMVETPEGLRRCLSGVVQYFGSARE